MMGGDPASVGRVKPVLRKYASNILHFGDVGKFVTYPPLVFHMWKMI
jgi:3-hydroxyisobutyrate dehydrogenase-like beta-hydroxyacid dehydrogenase